MIASTAGLQFNIIHAVDIMYQLKLNKYFFYVKIDC